MKTYLFVWAWREWVTIVTSADTDSGGYDHFTAGVDISEVKFWDVSKVGFWMVNGVNLVVHLDDGIEQWFKCGVCLWITCIQSDPAVQILGSCKYMKYLMNFQFIDWLIDWCLFKATFSAVVLFRGGQFLFVGEVGMTCENRLFRQKISIKVYIKV